MINAPLEVTMYSERDKVLKVKVKFANEPVIKLRNNNTIINENDHSEAINKITADLEKDLASSFLNEYKNLGNSSDSEGDSLELTI